MADTIDSKSIVLGRVGSSPTLGTINIWNTRGPGDEIGRRSGLKIRWFTPYGFESRPGYHFKPQHSVKGADMTFGDAIEALKQGKRVTRKGWSGKGTLLWLKQGTEIKSEWCKDPMLKQLADQNGGTITGLPTICMSTNDDAGNKAILTGWLASTTDMLSDDWEIVK